MNRWYLLVVAAAAFSVGCASSCGASAGSCVLESGAAPGEHWLAVCEAMDDSTCRDVTLLVGGPDGRVLRYERGRVSASTRHRIASASKWPAAAVILRLVGQGRLSLEDRPSDYLDWWTSDPSDARSRVTLETLLSFTSGFDGDESCIGDADGAIEACARTLHDTAHAHEPGEVFVYGGAHLHVAAAMAQAATGRSWVELMREQLYDELSMEDDPYYEASDDRHPRVAGGLAMSGRDYERFMIALTSGAFLGDGTAAIFSDRSGDARLGYSPLTTLDVEWRYAYGSWKECDEPIYGASCAEERVFSSPGYFGFYPWADRERDYWAIVSVKQGLFGGASRDSVELGWVLQPLIERAWAEGAR